MRRPSTSPGCLTTPSSPPLTLRFLLLPARQLSKPFHELIDLVVRGLLISPLDGLILVLQLVEFKLKQVREIFGRILSTATATATATLLHTHLVVCLLGPLQLLQGPLLSRQRRVDVLLLKCILGRLHLGRSTRQHLKDRAKGRVGRHHAAVHPPNQGLDLLAQSTLRQRQKDEVLAILLFIETLAVADDVKGCRNDLPLGIGQRAGIAAAAAAAAAATL